MIGTYYLQNFVGIVEETCYQWHEVLLNQMCYIPHWCFMKNNISFWKHKIFCAPTKKNTKMEGWLRENIWGQWTVARHSCCTLQIFHPSSRSCPTKPEKQILSLFFVSGLVYTPHSPFHSTGVSAHYMFQSRICLCTMIVCTHCTSSNKSLWLSSIYWSLCGTTRRRWVWGILFFLSCLICHVGM